MLEWIEWIGILPVLGLTGNWRGYRMGGKAIGGANMSTDMKKKFEAARAAGNMDQAKALADKAQKFNDDKKAEKAKAKEAKTIAPAAATTRMSSVADIASSQIKADATPFLKIKSSDKFGSSVMITGSYDPPSAWSFGDWQNSRNFRFDVTPAGSKQYYDAGQPVTVTLLQKSPDIKAKFRKFTGTPEKAMSKVNQWIADNQSQ